MRRILALLVLTCATLAVHAQPASTYSLYCTLSNDPRTNGQARHREIKTLLSAAAADKSAAVQAPPAAYSMP